jgi:hypothetical protein
MGIGMFVALSADWRSKCCNPSFPPTKEGRMQAFQQHRRRIEPAASAKFDRGLLEPDGRTVLVKAADLV